MTISCNQNLQNTAPPHFVSLKDSAFYLNGSTFYPLVVNYKVTLYTDGQGIWPGPYSGYLSNITNGYTNRDSSLIELRSDFELIRQLGFNTIRVVGIGEYDLPLVNTDERQIFLKTKTMSSKDTIFGIETDSTRKMFFATIADVLSAAKEYGLKVIFLTNLVNELSETEEVFMDLCKEFKDNETLMAYDYFNEPQYFDSLSREKVDVQEITQRWDELKRQYAPNQLSTIGLAGIREVFEWDPNLLQVDFLSFHPYEYEPDQVRNEIYWYKSVVDKPWIIGETSLPADGDSVSFDSQTAFAKSTLEQAVNCRAAGYSWWQYKDVNWSNFHSNFMGVVSRTGEVNTNSGRRIAGTPKPVSKIFSTFKYPERRGKCLCAWNYHNYSFGNESLVKGKIVDDSGNPIENAVFMAWSEDWKMLRHAITRKDGTFELFGHFVYVHWIAGGTKYLNQSGRIPKNFSISESAKHTWDIGTIVLEPL